MHDTFHPWKTIMYTFSICVYAIYTDGLVYTLTVY
jgi:hypothetical protein